MLYNINFQAITITSKLIILITFLAKECRKKTVRFQLS